MTSVVLPVVEAIGIVAFGFSGALVSRRRCLDAYGSFVLALVTALGGGTIRDLILGIAPPVNLVSPTAVVLALAPAAMLSLPAIGRVAAGLLSKDREPNARAPFAGLLLIIDAVGLSAFTVSGATTGLANHPSVMLAVFCGVITATGGGMIRDMLAGIVPAVLRREIYAVASLLGAATVAGLARIGCGMVLVSVLGFVVTFALRIGTFVLQIHLPVPDGCTEKARES